MIFKKYNPLINIITEFKKLGYLIQRNWQTPKLFVRNPSAFLLHDH